ncbi:fetuin-B [Antennarius striatus]|uniref:fetuin-B n=1 Tax=Antennarius striatus TaxID=241820 RepID=UPI0035B09A13
MDKSIYTLLLLLSLLSSDTVRVYAEDFARTPIAPVPCNDKAVEKLSRLATTYINEDRDDGFKFALNHIANVHLHAQGPAGNVYYLDLDVLETKCHVGSPKSWKRCDIRPFMETQISGNCNTTVLHTPEGYSYLYSYECTLVPDPPEKLQQTCPTCPLLLAVDSPQAQNAARVTMASYKRQSTLGAGLGVKRVLRASAQTIPVKATFVEYTVQECPERASETGSCHPLSHDSEAETAGFCTGSVHEEYDVQVSCEMFKIQNADIFNPVEPQVHNLPQDPEIPTFKPPTDQPGNDWAPSEPTLPPAVQPEPFDPTPMPFDPTVDMNPATPRVSSSSESAEDQPHQQHQAPAPHAFYSSSEEIGGPVALRPPFNFRYKKSDRKKRLALVEASPARNPIFLPDFPSGSSPFRSCPSPSRYTTV